MIRFLSGSVRVFTLPRIHATDEHMHFLSMVDDPAVPDVMLSTAMLRLEIGGVRFAVGHRVDSYPTRVVLPTEEVRAVFGVWYPRRWRHGVPTRFRDLLYVTDKRIFLAMDVSPTGALRSVAAGKTPLERASASLAGTASRIAGPYYAWTSEAWQADLEVGPFGREAPMSAFGKLWYVLGLVLVTAPRYRLTPAAGVIIRVARMLSIRVLYSNPATAMIVGGAVTWAAAVFQAESGSAVAASFLSTAVPASAWGVRWLRAHSTPPPRKYRHRNR